MGVGVRLVVTRHRVLNDNTAPVMCRGANISVTMKTKRRRGSNKYIFSRDIYQRGVLARMCVCVWHRTRNASFGPARLSARTSYNDLYTHTHTHGRHCRRFYRKQTLPCMETEFPERSMDVIVRTFYVACACVRAFCRLCVRVFSGSPGFHRRRASE